MTKNELLQQFEKLNIQSGMKILIHVSLSKIGRLEKGPEDLINALKELVGEKGIIVMPAYNSCGDYKPNLSIVNDYFRNQPDVICTNQVIASFAVWGIEKEKIASNIEYNEDGLSFENGEKSTLARLYENNGWSLMLGTDYSTCTMIHLAENRANWPSKFIYTEEYVAPDGTKIPFHDVAYQEEDFNDVGKAFENKYKDDPSVIRFGKIGNADCRFFNQKVFVDFAVDWMKSNRK